MTQFSRLFLASAALALGAPVAAQQAAAPVIIIVDLERVVNQSAAGQAATAELQGRAAQLQSRATALQGELQAELQAIQQGQQNNSLTGAALEQRAQQFGQRQQAAQAELGQAENELGRSRAYVIQQIETAVQPIVTQVMRERGAAIALAKGATLQHTAALEVTDEIIARLNQQLPRVSSTPPPAQAQQPAAQQQVPAQQQRTRRR